MVAFYPSFPTFPVESVLIYLICEWNKKQESFKYTVIPPVRKYDPLRVLQFDKAYQYSSLWIEGKALILIHISKRNDG